jgi:8-oxo-dGTP pyrophosphatase MutT (NUDIX family)
MGVVRDGDGRVLLIHQADEDQRWMPPGGHLEPGESPAQAVERELKEELGIQVEAGPLIGLYTLRLPEELGLRFVFQCTIVSGEPEIRAPDEVAELGWFDPDDLPHPLSYSAPFAVADAVAGRAGVSREIGPGAATIPKP